MNKAILKQAVEEAKKSNYKFRVGAVMFSGSKIINKAYNDPNYIGYLRKHSRFPTRHAEIMLFHNTFPDCSVDVLVVRVSKKDKLTMARPCKTCMKYLIEKRVRRVYFTNYDGEIEKIKL